MKVVQTGILDKIKRWTGQQKEIADTTPQTDAHGDYLKVRYRKLQNNIDAATQQAIEEGA